jgi:hypothetical protein
MAQKYTLMIEKYKSLHSSYLKIAEFCSPRNTKFSPIQSTQVSALLSHHESALLMYPQLKTTIYEMVQNKLEEYLSQTNAKLNSLLSDTEPQLEQVIKIIKSLYDIYHPLSVEFARKRFTELIDKLPMYENTLKIIETEYPQWVKLYQYYSLPRNTIDEAKITNVIRKIEENQAVWELNFYEARHLNPRPDVIKQHFLSLLNNLGRDSIINYIKIENEILNAPDNESRFLDIIRFLKHLNEKLSDDTNQTQVKNELLRIKSDFIAIMNEYIENQIRTTIHSTSGDIRNRFKSVNEMVFKQLYELNDLEQITKWQNTLKTISKIIFDAPKLFTALQNDYELYQKFSDNEHKEIFSEKLSANLKKISELIPLMVYYQTCDVEKIIQLSTEIKLAISHQIPTIEEKQETKLNNTRLIILDKYTNKNIVIFKKDSISLGRDEAINDIILKSDWVSSAHSQFNFLENEIMDLDSTNGTFYKNEKNKQFTQINSTLAIPSDQITISIGDAFDILVSRYTGYVSLKIIRINDEEVKKRSLEYAQSLFNTEFIWLKKFSSIAICTFTSNIKTPEEKNKNQIVITLDENFTAIDNENSTAKLSIKPDEEIITDRYTIHLA